ncbi:hypothetical protein ILUMI_06942, partial [Ignelater luminosus]
ISVIVPSSNNSSSIDWWLGADEEDASSPLPLDASEGGLWSGNFVPPPPRPIFLDEGVTPDGLTTCDLCSWAWQNSNAFTLDAAMEAPGEIGWVLTLVIVSLISAAIGAVVMIIVLHCRRTKNPGLSDAESNPNSVVNARRSGLHTTSIPASNDKNISPAYSNGVSNNHPTNSVWSWLSRRSTAAPPQLDPPPTSPAENHYTHMDETYSGVGEALYAELDRESTLDRDSNSPAYQNSAYTDPDAPPSSAPSSAYYSDLSVTTVPDRAYEVVGLATMPVWDSSINAGNNGSDNAVRRPIGRLAAISEAVTVPSDYV